MTWTHPGYEAVADLLVRRTGLLFGPARRVSAEVGIQRAMDRAGVAAPDRYLELLGRDAAALDDLVVELTVGETYFFREPAQFAFVRREILPDLWRRHGPGAAVRAWSAGCASGEEAYSLAILLMEEGAGLRSHLLASDISRAALARARRAEFGAWSLRGEGAVGARPYLQPHGAGRFLMEECIRRRVHFEYLNLALDVYPSLTTDTWGMHIIFCRNVMIYFNQATIEATARRLYESLAPGGWLLTSASDPPLAPHARFEAVTTDAGVFYRRDPGSLLRPFLTAPPIDKEAESPAPCVFPMAEAPAFLPPILAAPAEPGEAADPLADARQAFTDGDYHRAIELTCGQTADAAACVVYVRSLANLDAEKAEQAGVEATARHPLSTELHYLHAVLLLSLGRNREAAQAVRRVLYLDRSLAVAHFTLGSILERCGDLDGARRAYRNVLDVCRARPTDESAPLSEGESAGRLAQAAAMQLAVLDAAEEKVP